MRDDVRNAIISGIPMRRMGTPRDRPAIAFLVPPRTLRDRHQPLVNGGLFIH